MLHLAVPALDWDCIVLETEQNRAKGKLCHKDNIWETKEV